MDAAEATVRQCDTLADRLRHEADRVAAYQTVRQKLELLQSRREQAGKDLAAAEAVQAKTKVAWQIAWRAAGISPETPEIMLAWLNRWQRLTERAAPATNFDRSAKKTDNT